MKSFFKILIYYILLLVLIITLIVFYNNNAKDEKIINEYEEKVIILETNIKEITEEKSKIEIEIETIKSENEELKININNKEKEIKSLKNKNKNLENEIQNLKKKLNNSSSSNQTVSGNKSIYQSYAHDLVINQYGWSESDFNALVKLWDRESGWNPTSKNKSSGAYGIPQALPASKMASFGNDYLTNYKTQIKWGLSYIKNRYGTPTAAWSHFTNKGWY